MLLKELHYSDIFSDWRTKLKNGWNYDSQVSEEIQHNIQSTLSYGCLLVPFKLY